MEVIILAGGLGTRLRSVVKEVPKCMAKVGGKPFLWYLLKYLTRFDVNKVILSVGYLREVIYTWIDNVKDDFPFDIDYAIEDVPLGTGGGIKLALKKATADNVFVLNGDTYFDVNLNDLMNFHIAHSSAVTMALKTIKDNSRYGRVVVDNCSQQIIEFKEKESCGDGLINGGVYIVNKLEPIFFGLPEKFSFEKLVLVSQCKLGKLFGLVQNGYFIDIGIPEDYHKADIELKNIL